MHPHSPLVHVIVAFVVAGILLLGLSALPMIDATIKKIVTVLVVVAVCLWALSEYGLI